MKVTGGERGFGARLWRAVRGWWSAWWWAVVAIGALVALVLGIVGFDQYYREWAPDDQRGEREMLSLVYQSVQLFLLQLGDGIYPLPPALQIARALAPTVAATTTIQALWPFLRERVEGFYAQHLSRGHVVICGVGRKGMLLTRGFRERGRRVVIVERDSDNEMLEACRALGAITLIGNATDPDQLRQAGVPRAAWVFAVTGDDAVNVDAALRARELAEEEGGTLRSIYAHIFDPHFCALLDVAEQDERAGGGPTIEFFNIVESGARALLSQYPIFSSPRAFETRNPHLLVVGLGYLGQSLVVQAANAWQGRYERRQQRLSILAVDRVASAKVAALEARYPVIAERCRLVGRDLDVNGAEFHSGAFLARGADEPITSAYVSLGDDSLSLAAGLALRRHLPDPLVPIVVSMAQLAGLARLLEERDGRGLAAQRAGLAAFGLLDRTCVPELLIEATREDLARAIHEVYLASIPPAEAGDAGWQSLTDDIQESNRRQADHIPVKLAVAGYRLAPLTAKDPPTLQMDPKLKERLARLEHERWNDEKLLDGWEYGPRRDRDARLNPYLQAWQDLSEEQRQPDFKFVEKLPAILAEVGLRIEPDA